MFPTDDQCADYLFRLRYPHGYVCPTCGSRKAWQSGPHRAMICENDHKISITAKTVMHRTKQPLTTWSYGAYLIATLTPGISALQFQRQLGIKRYETAFQLLHKLRAGLGQRPKSKLRGDVEVDDVFVGGVEHRVPGEGLAKTIVMVAVERREVDDPKASGGHRFVAGRVRMGVVPDNKGPTIAAWIRENVADGSTIHCDGHKSYSNLPGYAVAPLPASRGGVPTGDHLSVNGRVVSNLKRWLLGTHKAAVRAQHLQAYLNEFAFRFNRRFLRGPAFVRALGLSIDAEKRPEYATLYATKAGEGWVHPNPDPTAADAVWLAIATEARPDVQAFAEKHAAMVREVIALALRAPVEPWSE